jgi:hypothetical protein
LIGAALLEKQNSSLASILRVAYPNEYEWFDWCFVNSSVPKGFWQNRSNQKRFLEFIMRELGLKTLEDWYNVKFEDIKRHGGSGYPLLTRQIDFFADFFRWFLF